MVQCSECIYWFQEENSNLGQCRKHAPQPKVMTKGTGPFVGPYNYRSIWPYTRDTDACGEGTAGARPKFKPETRDQTLIKEELKTPNSFDEMVKRARVKNDNK